MGLEDIKFLTGEDAHEIVQNFPEIMEEFVRGEVAAVLDGADSDDLDGLEGEVVEYIADVQKLSEEGDFAVATVGGKPIAMMGFKIAGRLEDKREVYRVRLAYTDPNFRGKGVYPGLREAFLKKMNEKYKNPPLATCTQNQKIMNHLERLGWEEISLAKYSDMKARAADLGVAPWYWENDQSGIEWHTYFYDPQKKAQQ